MGGEGEESGWREKDNVGSNDVHTMRHMSVPHASNTVLSLSLAIRASHFRCACSRPCSTTCTRSPHGRLICPVSSYAGSYAKSAGHAVMRDEFLQFQAARQRQTRGCITLSSSFEQRLRECETPDVQMTLSRDLPSWVPPW